jgi:hypothetical protein
VSPRSWILLLGLGALFFACDPPRPARFPHVTHLAGLECGRPGEPACLNCASCHGDMREGGFDRPMDPKTCAPCHKQAEEILVRSLDVTPPDVQDRRFPHPQHLKLERIAGQCVNCHEGVVSARADASPVPPMAQCLTCHLADFERANCTFCHTAKYLERTKPRTFLQHDSGWIRQHGEASARMPRVCSQCHSDTSCTDCHDVSQGLALQARMPDAIGRELPHRGDILTRHPFEARTQPSTCVNCHTPASCNSCHIARGVSAGRRGAPSPHPPGWMGRDTEAPEHHGRAARRNLMECASCHDQGPLTNCIQCHRPGGSGGNPHPGGWRGSRDQTVCRYCHE